MAPIAPSTQASSPFGQKTSSEVKIEPVKPFITVATNYVPSAPQSAATYVKHMLEPTLVKILNIFFINFRLANKSNIDARSVSEDNKIFKKMMLEEIKSFEAILKQSIQKSRQLEVVVCSKEQCADLLTKSSELQEICDQATDTTESLKSDVQTLRLSMYEAMAMSAEAQSKVEMINNPTYAVPLFLKFI